MLTPVIEEAEFAISSFIPVVYWEGAVAAAGTKAGASVRNWTWWWMASWAVRWTVDPTPYLWLDALTQKVREAGRIVNVSVVVATAVNSEGKREIVGMDVGTSEDGAFWLAFLRSLSASGLGGVELVVLDAHQGLRGAIAAVLPGRHQRRPQALRMDQDG